MKTLERHGNRIHFVPIAVILLYVLVMNFFFSPFCLIRQSLGIPCPTCGMTRAVFALFRRDVAGAFYFHPAWWAAPLLLYGMAWNKKKLIYLSAAILIVVYALRIAWAMHTGLWWDVSYPVSFQPKALLWTIFR